MKNILTLTLIAIFVLSSCGESSELETLKEEKKEVQSKIDELKVELTELNEKIAMLDSTAGDKLELVTVLKLQNQEFNQYIESQGKTFSENDVMVTTDMGGLVKKVLVDEGQYVSKGQALIQLDNSVISNQLSELETSLVLAKDVFEKRQRLWDQNIGSEIEYLQAKTNYESLLDKKATVQTQLGKSTITAPISGYVDMVSLNPGEMASPGMPAIQVINNSQMEIKVDLPEIYLGKASKGDKILVDIPAINLSTAAKIKSVGQSVNNFNRSFQVIATVDNSKGLIKTNMLAKVKFTNQSIDNSIVIPASLLQESSKGYFVYIAETDSSGNITARKKSIEVGESYNGQILVTSGLKNDEVLIDKGFRNVLDGQFISVQK